MRLERQGIDRLTKKLSRLGGNVDEAIEEGLLRGGKAVQSSAKLLCPVDSGALRNSIVAERESALEVKVGTNLEYAAYVEFGTGKKGNPSVPHTTKEQWRYQDDKGNWYTTSGQPPQPFLGPALKECKDQVKKEVVASIEKAIAEASGNG